MYHLIFPIIHGTLSCIGSTHVQTHHASMRACREQFKTLEGMRRTREQAYFLRSQTSRAEQTKLFAACMAQDCALSLSEVGECRWASSRRDGKAGGLCYGAAGQAWCDDNPSSSDCVDMAGKPWFQKNLGWLPQQKVPYWSTLQRAAGAGALLAGDVGVAGHDTYSCACLKHCSYGGGGAEGAVCATGFLKVGADGSPASDITPEAVMGSLSLLSWGKCACFCGAGAEWEYGSS